MIILFHCNVALDFVSPWKIPMYTSDYQLLVCVLPDDQGGFIIFLCPKKGIKNLQFKGSNGQIKVFLKVGHTGFC